MKEVLTRINREMLPSLIFIHEYKMFHLFILFSFPGVPGWFQSPWQLFVPNKNLIIYVKRILRTPDALLVCSIQ